MKKIYFHDFDTEFGKMHIAVTDMGAVRISFVSDFKGDFLPWMEDNYPNHLYEKNITKTKLYIKKIQAFLSGRSETLDFPIELKATGFRRKALLALKEVGCGQTISYSELAARAGSPRAGRAAGRACAKNPLPLIIPCHRVIAAGNRLGGYGGGERLKRKLLENEGIFGLKD